MLRKTVRKIDGLRAAMLPGFLCVFMIMTASALCSQNQSFRNFTVHDGLAGSTVYEAMQDSKGYVWFATETGVSRFDGLNFTNFSVEDGLPINEVFQVKEDSRGRIWMLGYSPDPAFFRNGVIHNALNDSTLAHLQARLSGYKDVGHHSSFLEDSQGNIWLGYRAGVLAKVSPDGKVKTFDTWKGVRFSAVESILELPEYGVVIFSNAGFIPMSEAQALIPRKTKSIYNSHAIHLGAGKILFSSGLNLNVREKDGTERVLLKNEIDKSLIHYLQIGPAGDVWVSTANGVYRVSGILSETPEVRRYLRGKRVSSLLFDQEDNIWFTLLDGGVIFTSSLEVGTYTQADGLAEQGVTALAASDGGELFIGYQHGKFDVMQPDGSIRHYSLPISGYSRDKVFDIRKGRNGEMLIGMDEGVVHFRGKILRVDDTSLKSFCLDEKGDLWVGASTGALNYSALERRYGVIRERGTRYLPAQYREMKINADPVQAICAYRGSMLLGTTGGLVVFENDSLRKPAFEHPLLDVQIVQLLPFTQDRIVVSTSGWGLGILDGDSILPIGKAQGLTSNVCKTVLADAEGNLWVGTNKGLNKITFPPDAPFRIANFSARDGLPSDDINAVTVAGGKIWLGTPQGLTVFDEAAMQVTNVPPPVHIAALRANDRLVDPYSPRVFQRRDNNIAIEYHAISFRDPLGIRYRIRLSGLNSDWQTTESNLVQYPSLPPGSYEFQVVAISQAGVQSEVPASVKFEIEPAWWELTGVILLAMVAGLGMLGLGFWGTVLWVRGREKQKTELEKRIASIEQKALQAQMKPHFVFNALNSIQSFIVNNEPGAAAQYLKKFSALIRKILVNSQKSFIPLDEELEFLKLYMELEALRFAGRVQFEVEIERGLEPANVGLPSLLLQPLLENAIWHGVMPRESGGRITLSVKRAGATLECAVTDDGIGREASRKLRKWKKHKGTGTGLASTRERLKIFEIQSGKPTQIKIVDLAGEDGTPAGTRVEITLPILSERTYD